jgi:hypothetical protein
MGVEASQDEPRGRELGHRAGPVDLRPDEPEGVPVHACVDPHPLVRAGLAQTDVEDRLPGINRH